jgi:hypothetical protein
MHIFSFFCGFYMGYKTHKKICSMSDDMEQTFMGLDKVREELISFSWKEFFSLEKEDSKQEREFCQI